ALTVVDDEGLPTAGMPVIELRRRLHRRVWVSLPFTDACAPLLEPERESRLLGGLEDARMAAGIQGLEIRAHVPMADGRQVKTALRHSLALERDEETVLRRLDPSQVQRNIRRAEREGVVVRRAERESDLDQVF